MTTGQLTLTREKLQDLAPCATHGFFGKRGTGKSTAAALVVLALHALGVPRFLLFTSNKDTAMGWGRTIPTMCHHNKDLGLLELVTKDQERRVGADRERFEDAERKKHRADPTYTPLKYAVPRHLRLCIVVDDCGSDRAFMHSKQIISLCADGRHYGIDVIFTMQYITQMHPQNRTQLDYVYMLNVVSKKPKQRIYEEYVGDACCSFKEFQCLLTACTSKPGRALFINNKTGEMDPKHRLKFISVPYPVPLQMAGHPRYIEYCRRHYMSETKQREAILNNQSTHENRAPTTSVDVDDGSHVADSADGSQIVDQGSIVSLNRRRGINLARVREDQHVSRDTRGNIIRVTLAND